MRSEEEKNQQEEEIVFEVEAKNSEDIATTPIENSDYSFRVVEGENGWGYQIYEDSAMRINQMHIPSIPGTKGFDSKEKAEKAARYVVNEMNKGVFPPTVNAEILKKIGAID